MTLSLLAGIALLASPSANAGTLTGGSFTSETVLSHSTDHYVIPFVGGEYARIALSGDGDTDLDIRVYDESGNLIKESLSTGDDEIVGWVPAWTGRYLVEVSNLGDVYNNYVLVTN